MLMYMNNGSMHIINHVNIISHWIELMTKRVMSEHLEDSVNSIEVLGYET